MLKTIFLILIIFYSVRFLTRILAPLFLKSMINRAQRNMNPNQSPRQEGEVSIKKDKKSESKKSSSTVGEYIDFEEIDDNQ